MTVWPVRECAAVQGMVFVLSVLKRAFNFVWICPYYKQALVIKNCLYSKYTK